MSFIDHKIQTFTKKISDLPDEPKLLPNELKAYFDSSPEELRQAHNNLCTSLDEIQASVVHFTMTAGVPETNVQDAIENVQEQLTDAIMGNIPSGSVTGEKLAQDVRDRLSAIEIAAINEAGTRASADSTINNRLDGHDSAIAQKCEVICGMYEGDEAETRTVLLGRTPKAVLLLSQAWGLAYRGSEYCYGGLALADSPLFYWNSANALKIVTNGFEVYFQPAQRLATNQLGRYHYIAFF